MGYALHGAGIEPQYDSAYGAGGAGADYIDWKGNRKLGGGMVHKRYYVHPQALDYADYKDLE